MCACREQGAGRDWSRFVPLLLFLVQRKESAVAAKLCVMVSRSPPPHQLTFHFSPLTPPPPPPPQSVLNALCSVYLSLHCCETSDFTQQQVCCYGNDHVTFFFLFAAGRLSTRVIPIRAHQLCCSCSCDVT